MTSTATKTRNTRSTAKKTTTEAQPAEAPTTTVKSITYREVSEFSPALKAARSLAKGNADLTNPLQLITHLAWKTPGSTVGWAKGTTANVVAYADDIAVPSGTPIPVAMEAALSAADKAATDKPQRDALSVLSKVIKNHTA